jgi:hypothetical protein
MQRKLRQWYSDHIDGFADSPLYVCNLGQLSLSLWAGMYHTQLVWEYHYYGNLQLTPSLTGQWDLRPQVCGKVRPCFERARLPAAPMTKPNDYGGPKFVSFYSESDLSFSQRLN